MMDNFKVYIKRGNTNYKEKKLISKIQEAIAKKMQEDPNFTFSPASNPSELQNMFTRYCAEDVPFEEIKNSDSIENDHKKFRDTMKPEESANPSSSIKDEYVDDGNFIDPLNREEPIVRDYVMKSEFPNTKGEESQGGRTTFDEPLSFEDSFEMPSDDDENKKDGTKPTSNGSAGQQKQQKSKVEPINPQFDDMSGAKKRRSTRKFAKYIVETVCMLSEKGFVWYANKDINDAKLAEYEISGEVNLSILVTLEDGQEATVKQFFQQQCETAKQLAKIPQEEKDDLAEALAEVLLEKGVAPTPMQELALIGVKIFGGQAIALLTLKSSTNNLMTQLKLMNEPQQHIPQQQPQQYNAPPVKEKEEPVVDKPKKEYVEPEVYDAKVYTEEMSIIEDENLANIINSPISTKE